MVTGMQFYRKGPKEPDWVYVFTENVDKPISVFVMGHRYPCGW